MTPGARLGPYEILAPIGAGGMGEVFKARDTRLDRTVAIKTSKEQFTERFEREARAVAALNHPNVCHLYDVGPNYLVMEYVEGPTLAERIAAGAIPVDEALAVARQIAEALEAAHEKGIVHRDLKPANIKLTPEGKVKVLDFGLAKAFETSGSSSGDPTNSPTLTLASTKAGVILGTAGYMSPEQARGIPADKRADIWSFGVVLLEMLTGRDTFTGSTVSDTLAAVLRADLQWDSLPAETPAAVRRLLRRCLERDRALRLHDIADARLELDEPAEASATAAAKPSRLRWIAAVVPAVLFVALLAAVLLHREPVPAEYQVSVLPPDKTVFTPVAPQSGGFALSPDGQTLAFLAQQDGNNLLWLRPLNSQTARPLPGTANAYYPFWSPDGRFLGFFADGKLKKIAVAGGPAQVLCDAGPGRGGTWSQDNIIVYTGTERLLRRVPAGGGQPVTITALEKTRRENAHYWPFFLPDGRHFLYLGRSTDHDQSAICAGSLDGKTTRCVEIVKAHSNAMFSPAEPGSHKGWLLFARGNTLLAQRFDADRLRTDGDAMPVAEQVGYLANITVASFSVSGNGSLVYGKDAFQTSRLMWVARDGKQSPLPVEPGVYQTPQFSPDGSRLALARSEGIWVIDLAHRVSTRFTFNSITDFFPAWSPDGKQIAFSSNKEGSPKIFVKASNGAGGEERISPPSSAGTQFPTDWSRDGKSILFTEIGAGTGLDLKLLSMDGEHKESTFLATSFNEGMGKFSPDGAWVAYMSDESGRGEIYVRNFAGTKFQVSSNGGTQPRWRADGRELYYLTPDGKLMATAVKTSPTTFERDMPRVLFEGRWTDVGGNAQVYDVTRDGQRFVFIQPVEAAAIVPLTLMINWQERLKK